MTGKDPSAESAANAKFWAKLGAVLYFGGSSAITQYASKALFTLWGFNYPLVVAMLQTAFILPCAFFFGKPELKLDVAVSVAPIAFVNLVNIVAGLMGTGGLSVPMFIALRRFTIVCTIIIETIFYKKVYDRPTLSAVFVMVFGSMIAAMTDLSFNLTGYVAVMINNIFNSLYLILVKNNQAAKSLSSTQLLFYNSMWNLPAMTALAFFSGQIELAKNYERWDLLGFKMSLIITCVLGLAINHATFVCARTTSPVTVSVTGSLKNVIMTIVGAFAFGDFKYHPANIAGLTVSMVGGIWYAMIGAMRK